MPRIINHQNTSVAQMADGAIRIVKVAGSNDAYDASARSATAITGDVMLRATLPDQAHSVLVALSIDAAASAGFVEMDHAVQLIGAEMAIYESGVIRPPSNSRIGPVWIARIGGTLSYRMGESFDTATVLRSVAGVTAPLFLDSSIKLLGSAVDVLFGRPGALGDPPTPARRAHLAISPAL